MADSRLLLNLLRQKEMRERMMNPQYSSYYNSPFGYPMGKGYDGGYIYGTGYVGGNDYGSGYVGGGYVGGGYVGGYDDMYGSGKLRNDMLKFKKQWKDVHHNDPRLEGLKGLQRSRAMDKLAAAAWNDGKNAMSSALQTVQFAGLPQYGPEMMPEGYIAPAAEMYDEDMPNYDDSYPDILSAKMLQELEPEVQHADILQQLVKAVKSKSKAQPKAKSKAQPKPKAKPKAKAKAKPKAKAKSKAKSKEPTKEKSKAKSKSKSKAKSKAKAESYLISDAHIAKLRKTRLRNEAKKKNLINRIIKMKESNPFCNIKENVLMHKHPSNLKRLESLYKDQAKLTKKLRVQFKNKNKII